MLTKRLFLWTTAAAIPMAGMAETTLSSSPTAPPVVPSPAVEVAPAVVETVQTAPENPDDIEKLTAGKDRILAEIALAQAKLDDELAPRKRNTERLQAELAELKAREELSEFRKKAALDAELSALRIDLEKATLINNLAKVETETEGLEIRRIENTLKKQTTQLVSEMELEEKKAKARLFANTDPTYLANPLKERKLVMSDRRIPMNGVITMNTADAVVSAINYYNNRDREMPIFIVIDDSPGGSVMAGYKILKAMQGSEAPVYVVLKSFAASMAACITTLAEKSFAYPNAVIMHHQIASFSGGNLTQQQEWVREMEEWWRRLAGPVADKMGISREEFIKRMYARSSTGDWNEFADQAQKLKWIDTIVDEIEETGTLRHPDEQPLASTTPKREGGAITHSSADLLESLDEKGRPAIRLPRLNPLDCYWLYNPDGYYKMP